MNIITRCIIVGLQLTPALLIAQSPVAHFSASDTAICDSVYSEHFTDQSTNHPTNWKWYFPGATPNTSILQNPTNIIYKGYGCYTVKLVVRNNRGADSLTDSNYICLDAPPHVVFTGPHDLCMGSQGTITAYGGTQYQWSTGQTTSAINIVAIVDFTYTVKISSGACYKDTSFTIAVGDAPPGWRFGGDTSICVGDTTAISVIPFNVGYTYLWSTGATTDSIQVKGATPGFYSYNLTVSNSGCKDSAKITVGVHVCSTGIESYTNPFGIEVYPNPSNGIFTLIENGELKIENEKSTIEVYDMLGEKVYSQFSTLNSPLSINLSGQPSGVYLYRVLSQNGELIGEGKLVVQR